MTAPAPTPPAPQPVPPAAPEPPATPPPAPVVPPVVPPAPSVVPPGATVAGTPNAQQPDPDIPDWARDPAQAIAMVGRARAEASKDRNAAKEQAAQEAAEAERIRIGKALGYIQDDSEKLTPDQIEQRFTAERDAAVAAQREAQVELAVWRNATAAGADPVALLDSRAFLRAVQDLDPSDSAGIQSAITEAVKQNARLAAVQAPVQVQPQAGASGSEFPGGPGAPDLDNQIAEAIKAGDVRRSIALKRQRANLS